MPDLKPGDIVQLKSGGPMMTVEEPITGLDGKERINCSWFNDDGNHSWASFVSEALKFIANELE